MAGWSTRQMGPQTGRTVIVTGATSGIGLEAAGVLAGAGAAVTVAARNPDKGAQSVAAIRKAHPAADVAFERVDLGSLASVKAFAERMRERLPRLDVLINNAGLMMLPTRQTTADGFERQFGTNHLGHFVLTAELWPLLLAAGPARVVTVSSNAHRGGRIAFDDLDLTRGYRPMRAYGQSKLANLMFALELQHRIDAAGLPVRSIAVHPGLTATGLLATGQAGGDSMARPTGLVARLGEVFIRVLGMQPAEGALSLLYGATAPEAAGGGYYGPQGLGGWRGAPGPAKPSAAALDRAAQDRLWRISEELTGTLFPVAPSAAAGS